MNWASLRETKTTGRKPGSGEEGKRRKIDGRQLDAKGVAMLRRYYKEIGRDDLAAAIVPPNRRNK